MGSPGCEIDARHRVTYALEARIRNGSGDEVERIELAPEGDGLCMGYHGWVKGDSARHDEAAIVKPGALLFLRALGFDNRRTSARLELRSDGVSLGAFVVASRVECSEHAGKQRLSPRLSKLATCSEGSAPDLTSAESRDCALGLTGPRAAWTLDRALEGDDLT